MQYMFHNSDADTIVFDIYARLFPLMGRENPSPQNADLVQSEVTVSEEEKKWCSSLIDYLLQGVKDLRGLKKVCIL